MHSVQNPRWLFYTYTVYREGYSAEVRIAKTHYEDLNQPTARRSHDKISQLPLMNFSRVTSLYIISPAFRPPQQKVCQLFKLSPGRFYHRTTPRHRTFRQKKVTVRHFPEINGCPWSPRSYSWPREAGKAVRELDDICTRRMV